VCDKHLQTILKLYMQMFEGDQGASLRRGAFAVFVVLAAFLAVKTTGELLGLKYIGAGTPAMNTITVEGAGDAVAIPDTALFTFSIVEKGSTVKEAQDAATKKMSAVTVYLKAQKIEDKDIKTTDYSVNPQYDYVSETCVAGVPCKPGRQVLNGYEVRQMVQIKVRDTAQAGTLLTGVGEKGASELSGLTFSVEDEDALKAEARGEAIDKAKAQADALAKKLGISLVRIVSFNENNGGPIMYGYGGMGKSMAMDAAVAPQAAPVPTPTGENKITSNVTITYEIR
jgi:uncharacterized protein YggE